MLPTSRANGDAFVCRRRRFTEGERTHRQQTLPDCNSGMYGTLTRELVRRHSPPQSMALASGWTWNTSTRSERIRKTIQDVSW